MLKVNCSRSPTNNLGSATLASSGPTEIGVPVLAVANGPAKIVRSAPALVTPVVIQASQRQLRCLYSSTSVRTPRTTVAMPMVTNVLLVDAISIFLVDSRPMRRPIAINNPMNATTKLRRSLVRLPMSTEIINHMPKLVRHARRSSGMSRRGTANDARPIASPSSGNAIAIATTRSFAASIAEARNGRLSQNASARVGGSP